jgi:hypothetical protein
MLFGYALDQLWRSYAAFWFTRLMLGSGIKQLL